MNYRKFTAILAVCSISLSAFGCSVKEEQTETSETSAEVITDVSELPIVSVTETEAVSETEIVTENAKYKYAVEFHDGDMHSITQYDEDGNEELIWFNNSPDKNSIYLFNTDEPDLKLCKRFETDYSFEKFENKDLHFLLDGIDTDSVDWKDYYISSDNYLSQKTIEDSNGNTVSKISVYLDKDGNNITDIYEYEYDDHNSVIHFIKTTYGTSEETTVSEYEYEYVYDDYGHDLCKDTYKNIDGSKTLIEREEFEYNENNNLISWNTYDLSGNELVLKRQMLGEYNDNNELVSRKSYDCSGDEPVLTIEWKFEYDEKGEKCYESTEYFNEFRLYEFYYDYDYNELGNLTYYKKLYRDTIYKDLDYESSLDRLSEIYYYY